ncbi:hypothetical protein [Oceanobacillus rekensis]|nr:hypothetical protein [Oceanobacillus rekensis]
MKNKLGVFSTILFFVGLVSYGVVLLVNDIFLFGAVIVSAIGFILALS